MISMSDQTTSSEEDEPLNEKLKEGNHSAFQTSQPLHQLNQTLTTYRYENTLVKTELAACLDRHKREIQELQSKYEAQLKDAMQKGFDCENVLSNLNDKHANDQRKLHQLNLQLTQKLKISEDEISELQTTKSKLQKEKKQILEETQHENKIKQSDLLKAKEENACLREEISTIKNTLEKERIELRELTTTLRSEKHQNQLLKNKVLEIEKYSELKIAEIQSEVNQLSSINQKENDNNSKQIKALKESLEEEKSSNRKEKELFAAKERELNEQISELRRANLSCKSESIQETTKHQQQIKSLESKLISVENKYEKEIEKLKEEIEDVTKKLYQEQNDKTILQARIGVMNNAEEALAKEKKEMSIMKMEISKLRKEIHELNEANLLLQKSVQQERDKMFKAQTDLAEANAENDKELNVKEKILIDMKARHEEELAILRGRISSLEAQLSDRGKSYLTETTDLKQKVRTYAQLIKKLRHKLELGAIKEDQLIAQKAALEENIPQHLHHKVQKELLELTHKHAEFGAYIRGMEEFRSNLPQVNELNEKVNAISQQLADLEESQLHCFSEVESL